MPAVIIPGGGVVEGGEPAAAMQREVAAIAREAGIALLGPNCMGLIDLNAPSATYIDDLPSNLRRGGTAAIAQSGSVTDAFVHAGTRIGWSRIISCGSEAVLDLCDHLAACLDDPATNSIVLFVEGFKRPERFLALADRALAEGKPILAVKVGRSSQARAAAIAHTGNLAGDERATDAALRAAGVIRFDDLDDLIEGAALVSRSRRLGRGVGKGRTGVVTVSTGEGSLIADLAPSLGLDLPAIPAGARSRIAAALPTLTHIENPLDPWGADEGGPAYRACFEAFVASGAYDVIALVHDFPYRSQPGEVALAVELGAELVAATAADARRPAGLRLPHVRRRDRGGGGADGRSRWRADPAGHAHGVRRDRETCLVGANARGPVGARTGARALAAARRHHAALRPCRRPATGGHDATGLARSGSRWSCLRAAGLPMVESAAIKIDDEAAMLLEATAAADKVGWPVAVKVDAPGFAHKTDAGGVALGVGDAKALHRSIRNLRPMASRGILVQPMASPGVELILGARRDPQFGPLVLVGIGGILAEVLDDVAVRLAPVRIDDALRHARRAPRRPPPRRRPQPADRQPPGGRGRPSSRWARRCSPTRPGWRSTCNPLIAGPGGARRGRCPDRHRRRPGAGLGLRRPWRRAPQPPPSTATPTARRPQAEEPSA